MKLIVGLGNPGARYEGTRHNVGFEVVDTLASRWNISLATEKFHGWFGTGVIAGEKTALLKPTTFMNRSGRAVLAAGRFYKLELDDLLVISDDLALPLGRLRIRLKGSSGLHKGLQDIIDRLSSEEWCRLRIGIDEPLGDPSGYVLGRFTPQERTTLDEAVSRGADASECWVEQGPEMAMNRFNRDPSDPE